LLSGFLQTFQAQNGSVEVLEFLMKLLQHFREIHGLAYKAE
jgi:hypothetical protein